MPLSEHGQLPQVIAKDSRTGQRCARRISQRRPRAEAVAEFVSEIRSRRPS